MTGVAVSRRRPYNGSMPAARFLSLAQLAPPAPASQPTAPRIGSLGEGTKKVIEQGTSLVNSLPTILLGVALFAAFVVLGMVVKWAIRKVGRKKHRNYNLLLAVARLAQGALFIVGLLVAAVVIFPDFTPTSALASLGFGSVAVAFAARDILQNYIAGILLLVTEPFRLGDQIVFEGYEGTVTEIQTRATFVRTYDGRRVVIPNAELFTNTVMVNTAFDTRRIDYDIGIGYGDDVEEAKRVMLGVMREEPTAHSEPPPEVLVFDLAGDHVTLRARWWIDPPQRKDALDSRDAVLGEMKRRLTAAGIDLPFPTQQVLIHDQTEDGDGDRRHQREGWPARQGDGDTRRKRGVEEGGAD